MQFGQFTFHDATHTTNKVHLHAVCWLSFLLILPAAAQKGYKLSPVTVITADNEHQLMAVSIFKSEGLADQMWQFRALADMLPHWATNVWVLSAGDGGEPASAERERERERKRERERERALRETDRRQTDRQTDSTCIRWRLWRDHRARG